MTVGWMETIRFIGLDLEVATVFAVATLDVTARALRSAWRRIPRGAPSLGSVSVRQGCCMGLRECILRGIELSLDERSEGSGEIRRRQAETEGHEEEHRACAAEYRGR